MSTRDTENRGFAAVAMTAIRYRCSAGLTSLFCHGCPVGTNSTSSSSKRSATSEAATRCPWWIGSKVPPITPMRRRVLPAGRAALTALTAAPSVALGAAGGGLALVAVRDVAVRVGDEAEQGED